MTRRKQARPEGTATGQKKAAAAAAQKRAANPTLKAAGRRPAGGGGLHGGRPSALSGVDMLLTAGCWLVPAVEALQEALLGEVALWTLQFWVCAACPAGAVYSELLASHLRSKFGKGWQ